MQGIRRLQCQNQKQWPSMQKKSFQEYGGGSCLTTASTTKVMPMPWSRMAEFILIDPLPLEDTALKRLGSIEAICLTAKCHQRSTWRYRKQFGVKVYAPEGIRPMEEEADVLYRAGDLLPGGLQAIHLPGPENIHYGFLLARAPGVLFCPDLLMHGKGKLEFVPAEFHDDPETTRESVRRLLDLRFSVLCFNHGAPITSDPHAALREVLKREAGQAGG